MKAILLHRVALLALLPAAIDAQAAPAIDATPAAWRDAGRARVDNGWRDGHPVTTIVPAVPGGAAFTFIYPADPNDGFASTAAPAAGAGCDAGESLGDCRKRTLAFVAAYWGSLLQSNVAIVASVAMPPVLGDCGNRPPYYGAAAARYTTWNFANAPHANTAYPAALANALAGADLQPGTEDIVVVLNEGADHGCEGTWAGWWYGTEATTPIPGDRIPMVATMLHEFGHGLGFASGYDVATGQSSANIPPIWGWYLYDIAAGKRWKDMTNAERVASATNDPNLVWAGADTGRWAAKFLARPVDLVVNAPPGSAGTYATNVSNAGVPLRSPLTADVVVVNDGVGPSARDGCETPFANAAALAGRIALMDGYDCHVAEKIRNAQSQGAVAVLVANTNASGPAPMYTTGDNAGIPGYGIAQALGNAIFAAPAAAFNATLQPRTGTDAYGAKDGCARIHAPATLAPGSSVSHFSGDGVPAVMMQPSAPIALYQVGLALNVLHDIGWTIRAEDGLFVDGFDGNPCTHAQP